jgi:acetate kinase
MVNSNMILVLNCGSQSIKWKLFDDNLRVKKEDSFKVANRKDYGKILTGELSKLREFQKDIKIVGHRVVHGGGEFVKPLKIQKQNLEILERFNRLAPLHNPFNILGIKISGKIFPKAAQITVFDTEFYANLEPCVYTYPLPEKIREKYGFRRYGFHGISHEYASKEAAKIIRKSFNKLKIISCHLGGGASITAIKNGRAVDTSMGFSPMEGIVMMTRSGSIDPEIILEMARDFNVQKVDNILNLESGLKGICGEKEMLGVLKKANRKDKKAKLALEIFAYQIKKYIGAYFAILGSCDLLVFTGKIGWGSSKIRNMICRNLPILKNTRVLPIKTDEELAIAKKVRNLL